MYITGNVELMKHLNKSIIINVIRDKVSISRADIARTTGLNRSTVTNLIRELLEEGMVKISFIGSSYSGGRRPEVLEMDYNAFNTVAINIGRYNTIVALLNLEAKVVDSISFKTPVSEGAEFVIQQLKQTIKELFQKNNVNVKKISGIGISISGLVDTEKGVVKYSPNFFWRNIHLKEIFEEEFQIKTFVENCTRCVARGEQWFGNAKGLSSFACVNIAYGIGAAIITSHQLITGVQYNAAEIGHLTMVNDGPVCNCGKRGCLEALAGGEAMVNKVKQLIQSGAETNIPGVVDGKIDAITVKDISSAAQQGDKVAKDVIQESAYYLGLGISHLINLFDPSMVILSGGVSQTQGGYLETILEVVKKNVMGNREKNCDIIFGKLGEYAEIMGASTLVLSSMGFLPPGTQPDFTNVKIS